MAWAFYRRKGFLREIVFTLAVLAWIIPEVVVAFAWSAFLDVDRGTLNTILSALGLGRPDWLFDYPLLTIIIFNTWRGSAFSILLFSSALETIPPSYVETADVVGALGVAQVPRYHFPAHARAHSHRPDPDHAVDLQRVHAVPADRRRADLPRPKLVSIYTYRTAFKFFEFGKGGAIAGRDDADQLHAGDGLSDYASASEGGLMRNYESTFSKLLLVLFSLACMAFFAMPLLWLLTAPFTPMTTLSVEIPENPTLDNFRTVFKNGFAIRALFKNNLIIAGGAMLSVATVATLASYGLSRTRIVGETCSFTC